MSKITKIRVIDACNTKELNQEIAWAMVSIQEGDLISVNTNYNDGIFIATLVFKVDAK